jgi:probable addiction module antidote protein
MKSSTHIHRASVSHHDAVVSELRASPEFAAEYIRTVMEDNSDDPVALRIAFRRLAQAYGFQNISRETGMSRTSLYKALSPGGNPSFQTVAAILQVCGLRLSAEPIKHRSEACLSSQALLGS